MTKQEEIREGTAKWLFDTDYQFTAQWEDAQPFLKEEYYKKADNLLSYLHSQGVVIKVERELPVYEKYVRDEYSAHDTEGDIYGKGQAIAMYNMLKTGYVAVEPLIAE